MRFIKACFFLFLSVFVLMSCEQILLDQESFMENEAVQQKIDDLLLSEGLTFTDLKSMVDHQKMYFVNNSGEDSIFIYELSLDHDAVSALSEIVPENVLLRAERFVHLGFKAHIAATNDGTKLVALENGGPNIAVIDIATKEIITYQKPSTSLTQVGFNIEGQLFAAGGSDFYRVDNWESNNAEFVKLEYRGLPTISGGDLLFLNDAEKPNSFLSFSRSNKENDGDGAYFVDVLLSDEEGQPSLMSYLRLFKFEKKVTGACIVGENHFATTHSNKDYVNFYNPSGEKLLSLKIKTADNELFVTGSGDLASVNSINADFYESHIREGKIYLSSNEEGKMYELNLGNGEHEVIADYGQRVNIHMGLIDNMMYYSTSALGDRVAGIYAWNIETNEESLLIAKNTGEKVVCHNNQVWSMGGNNLRIIDIETGELVFKKRFSEVGGGGDLLISPDGEKLLALDRRNKTIWEYAINNDYELVGSTVVAVKEINGAAYNRDGTIIVASKGELFVLDPSADYEVIGQKLLGFVQNNGDMTSTYTGTRE